ncbi:MAG: T9SS type A sorting domain-containing protein [Ignavibacteriales bacterium]|nr:MAG: T9SS type A sorting domain-containing protein [Ignavibacteriales bacterium]
MFTLDKQSGIGTLLGSSLFLDIKSIAIHPSDNIMYGLSSNSASSRILRINATLGDAYTLYEVPVPDLYAIAFDTTGNFYAAARTGEIYDLDLSNGNYTLVSTSMIFINAMAFHPQTNELYAAIYLAIGAQKDRIFKVDVNTGDTTLVGRTGFNVATNALFFDENANLFGATGGATVVNNFISIDAVTGVGTTIGATGFKNVTGLAFTPNGVTGIDDEPNGILPSEFSLEQNYPNPFNPATTIEFSLPKSADVKIVIYNLLGEVVTELINRQLNAGVHRTVWNSSDREGKQLSSGVYFYELRANSNDGSEFQQIRKMVLLK